MRKILKDFNRKSDDQDLEKQGARKADPLDEVNPLQEAVDEQDL